MQCVPVVLTHSPTARHEPQPATSQSPTSSHAQPPRQQQVRVEGQQPAAVSGGVQSDPGGPAAEQRPDEGGADTTSRQVRTVVYDDDDDYDDEELNMKSTRRIYQAVYTSTPAESPAVSAFTHCICTLLVRMLLPSVEDRGQTDCETILTLTMGFELEFHDSCTCKNHCQGQLVQKPGTYGHD